MRTVDVHVDPFPLFGIDVAADVPAAFDHEAGLARSQRMFGNDCVGQPCADKQIIVMSHSTP